MLLLNFLHSLLVLVGVVCVWRCVFLFGVCSLLTLNPGVCGRCSTVREKGERDSGLTPSTELVYKDNRVVSALAGGAFGA